MLEHFYSLFHRPLALLNAYSPAVQVRSLYEKEIHVDEDGNQLEIACDMCEEKLPTGEDFRRHARVVHRKKVYILQKNRQTVYCDECGKSFKVNLITTILDPNNFSNLNYNCSNLLDQRNLQEVVKAFCYQKLL